ncbi:CRISPR-associated protein Cas8a1/Csx13 [Leptolyngbya sp. PL-A3]
MISNNLVAGKPWWSNLFEQLQEKNVVAESLKYTDFFIEMADQTSYNIEAEKLFIKACHEALRKTYAQVYDRAGENEIAQVDRKNQQIISRLKQCHNADRFRSFIADFFAKAGIITVFEENQEELFPITRGIADWRVSRDLFLLAMASYPRKKSSDGGENSAASNSFRE